jgi:hypothetical protein
MKVIPVYSKVRVITSRHLDEGIAWGEVGYVIEDFGDGNYEVEISSPDGTTIAMFVAAEGDLEILNRES